MLDIQKIITLSTAHISEKTAQALDMMAKNPMTITETITVYNKDDIGWFIYCPEYTNINDIPEKYKDLRTIITFAHDHDCEIICLDADYETVDYLPTYDW